MGTICSALTAIMRNKQDSATQLTIYASARQCPFFALGNVDSLVHTTKCSTWISKTKQHSSNPLIPHAAGSPLSKTNNSSAKCKGKVHPRKGHEGPEGELRYSSTLSLTSAQDGVGRQHQIPAALSPGNRPGTHCVGGWVGPRAGLDGCGKSRPYRHSIPGPSSP
jgi:hypothetical protein